jgi:hypothetical protein
MPHSIPPGLTREHVLQALADLDTGTDHPFGLPTGYELVHEGRCYPPKAVVGLAFRPILGRILRPDEFSGGEAPGQANHLLRQLGFTVRKRDVEKEEESRQHKDWSDVEIERAVADYFAMLRQELLGQPYNKTEHRRALLLHLGDRKPSAVENKHQNISAILVERGLPYINGYKPYGNYQRLLAEKVEEFLAAHPEFFLDLLHGPVIDPASAPHFHDLALERVVVEPPEMIFTPNRYGKPWLSLRGRRIDFAAQDARNRKLGKLGEEFALWFERGRLVAARRDDLAAKVRWVAEELGDGLGFDILSFDADDDSPRYVEVKATGLGKHFPFYVTDLELRCSEDVGERFHLLRVFDLGREPKLYVLPASLRVSCELTPTVYQARII